MTSYMIFAVAAYALMIIAAVVASLSLRKFMPGEFKNLVKTLMGGIWFLIVPYLFILIRDATVLDPNFENQWGWPIYGFMLIVALYLIKFSWKFHGFSETYGFAEE